MRQLQFVTSAFNTLRAHRRLIAVWVGSFSALATALVVGAFATGGGTLDPGSASPPPNPLDISHPCKPNQLPSVSQETQTMLQVGPPPISEQQISEIIERADQLRSNVEAVVNPEAQTTEQQILQSIVNNVGGSQPGNGQQSSSPPPPPTSVNPVPTPNADPIVNAPPAQSPYTEPQL